MELNLLKIDLDMETMQDAIRLLRERLAYMHDLKFFYIDNIQSVVLIKKSSFGARIKLKSDLSPEWVIIFQLILGSDWMKETNTCLNHFKFDMEYSNRLFTSKRYKNDLVKHAEVIDITDHVFKYVNHPKRLENFN